VRGVASVAPRTRLLGGCGTGCGERVNLLAIASGGGRRAGAARWRPGVFGRVGCRVWAWSLLVLCVVVGVLLVGGASAFALSQRGHVFAFAFGRTGAGEGEFDVPDALAVNQSTGEVYVADRLNNRVEVFEPQLNGEGVLVGEKFVRSFAVPSPDAIAVDSSTGSSDPSRGDVYVVGSTAREVKEEEPDRRVFKFSAAGTEIAVLRKFKEATVKGEEREEAEEFEEVQGLGVDASGDLFVYEAGAVDVFDDRAKKNEGLFSIPAPVRATRGFALDSQDDLYVGHESESPETGGLEGAPPVVGKLEALTGTQLAGELDQEPTSAVAVNTEDTPANGVDELDDAYITNVGSVAGETASTVAAFTPGGSLIQRFAARGLREASGIAVDDRDGAVFVTDAASDEVDVFELEAAGPPTLDSVSVQVLAPTASVGSAVRLQARIDPVGSDTHYQFEYGTAGCGETLGACTTTSEADVGEGFGAQAETLELRNLAPGTYHYRVLAHNGHGSAVGAEHTFTVLQTVGGLADGRAWEMVSPPSKGSGAIEPLTREGGVILAAEDGEAFTYVADGAITEDAQGNRTPEAEQILATRGPGGWSSQDIATPQSKAQGLLVGGAPEYRFFSPELSLALLEPWGLGGTAEPPLAPGVTSKMAYLRDDQPIAPEAAELESYAKAEANSSFLAPGYLPVTGGKADPVGATPDLNHIVLNSGGLYEWSSGGLRFVSALPDGTPVSQVALGYAHIRAGAISSDGSRVIWTADQESPAHLYLTDTVTGQTIQLDAAVEGVSEPEGSAEFQAASSDGSRVFFLDKQRLTSDSTALPGQGVGKPDLYECEIIETVGKLGCRLHDLTVDLYPGEHADVQGMILGASEDGSSVYFVARGVLAGNESDNGETAVHGRDNLYELREQAGKWTTTFIAGLSGEDSPEWEGGEHANTAFLTARVSPDGRYLAFMSAASLTGYGNIDENSGERDEEVYLYDSSTASLTCVSCDPSGAPPAGVFDTPRSSEGLGLVVDRRGVWSGHWLAGNIPGWTAQSITSASYQSRYLSDEGRLFFNSPADLVAGATNHKNDVYEYEPAGVGSCETGSGGCVALVSSGTSEEESAFLEATPSGDDVFFLTAGRLLPQDTDTAFDVYDARVCTPQSPCLTPPAAVPAGCSSADVCRPASPSQQAPVEPGGSATFSGPGNLPTQPPAAGQGVKAAKTGSKPLTRAQKLARALKACRGQHPHSRQRRTACEAHARRLYAPRHKRAGAR
jgi:hypothetical protein